ncbi:MAG TPA: NAD(P)-dependent oxidoreductase [Flavobacteriaceae bacterium]|nr:NAD(P)-dependent oxidoreductase [Flavobacteriaceae bacterium]
MPKQILLLQDLGISSEEVIKEVKKLDYEVIDDPGKATPGDVEIIITVKKEVGRKQLEKFPNLKMVAVAFTGYDSVDLEACQERDIAVYNVPHYATNSVAELAVGLAISLLREIPEADQIVKDKKWELKPGQDLKDKTIGIVGTGAIGIATARLFKAFGCKILGWSRSEHDEFKNLGGSYIKDKKEFFAKADIVSVHLPLTEETKGSIAKEELEAMKKTGFIINTARGPIINESDLIMVLKNQKIAGAAIDVFDTEPVKPDNELLTLDNVILTPHIAFNTEEALNRRAKVTFKNIKDFQDGKKGNRVG